MVEKLLIITGNEINHNYFVHSLKKKLPKVQIDTLKYHSGIDNYQYYYGIYAKNIQNEQEKNFLIDFIFHRNITFAKKEPYELLKNIENEIICRTKSDFDNQLDDLMQNNNYDAVFCYGAPIITNQKLLKMQTAFNIHMGLSKYYRGGTANILALKNFDFDKVGLTCHQLRNEIDGGDVLFEIENIDYNLIDNLDTLTHYLLSHAIDKIVSIITTNSFFVYKEQQGEMFFNKNILVSEIIQAQQNIRTMKMDKNIKSYIEDGLTIFHDVIDTNIIKTLRQDIVDVISEVYGKEIPYDGTQESFVKETTRSLWKIVNDDPKQRNLIYKYIQRVPSLYQFANLDILRIFAKNIGMKKPSVREIKVQMYMPWEKLFFQCTHQDINSLDSDNSVTFWFPLHFVPEESAVSYHKFSHKEGPVKHEEYIDEKNGVYHVCIPEVLRKKYPIIEKAVVDEGDLIALNRMVFHSSPRFEDQKWARWTVLVRYDDIAGNGFYENITKYESYTPFDLERYNKKILPKIREFLNKKPVIQWSEPSKKGV